MCEPMTMGLIGGSLLGGLAAGKQQVPTIPTPAPVAAPPESQAAKTPDTQQMLEESKGTGQAGGAAGMAQTFLTPVGGIDSKLLKLDRKTLY